MVKKLKIKEKIYNITPGIQKVLTQTSNIPLKKLNDKANDFFANILKSLGFENYKALRGQSKTGKDRESKSIFKKHNMKGQRIEEIIIPSNKIDIHTRLEILLGLNLSCHGDILTEASNLVMKYTREMKYATNSNIEKLLINFLPVNRNYLARN